MSEIKLKPCPFCGGKAEMGIRDASAFVMCAKCLARSRMVVACADYTAREVAADEWNQRNSITQNQSKWEICSDGYYPCCLSCKKEPPG